MVKELVWGLVIGGVVALLFAPKKGSETRQIIKDKAVTIVAAAKDKSTNVRDAIKDKASGIVNEVRGKTPMVTNADSIGKY